MGNFAKLKFEKNDNKLELKTKLKYIFLIGLMCLFSSLMNPIGYKILLFPFRFINENFILTHVDEFMPTNMNEQIIFKIFFFLSLFVICISKWRLNRIELIIYLFFSYMAFKSVRYTAFYGIMISPIVIRRIDCIMKKGNCKLKRFYDKRGRNIAIAEKKAKGFIYPILVVIIIIIGSNKNLIIYGFNPERHPINAVNFILNEKIDGNMFNNDEFGDYLIYAAYPKYKVFFDGRIDMYGEEFVKKYIKITNIKKSWEDYLENKKIGWVFYKTDSFLAKYLYERNDWHLIYSDKLASIFVRNKDEYSYLIEKYKDIKLKIIDEE